MFLAGHLTAAMYRRATRRTPFRKHNLGPPLRKTSPSPPSPPSSDNDVIPPVLPPSQFGLARAVMDLLEEHPSNFNVETWRPILMHRRWPTEHVSNRRYNNQIIFGISNFESEINDISIEENDNLPINANGNNNLPINIFPIDTTPFKSLCAAMLFVGKREPDITFTRKQIEFIIEMLELCRRHENLMTMVLPTRSEIDHYSNYFPQFPTC